MAVRVSISALDEDFERAAGSCETVAKLEEDALAAMFMAGASQALRTWRHCRKPEEYGSLIAPYAVGWRKQIEDDVRIGEGDDD